MAESHVDDTPKRRVGRPQKYDWLDKRPICYQLYVEEKKTAEEIAKYFADRFNGEYIFRELLFRPGW